MNKERIISFIPVLLGMLILHYFGMFPLFIFVPILVFGSYVELRKVFRGELRSLVPILYDLGAISCLVTASFFFKDNMEAYSKEAVGVSLFCLLGAFFIGSGTYIRDFVIKNTKIKVTEK